MRWQGRASLSIFFLARQVGISGSYGLSGGPVLDFGRIHVPIRANFKVTGNPACPSATIETESGDCTDLLASASSSVLLDAVHREDFKLYLGAGGDVGWLTDYHLVAGIQYKMFFGEIRAGQKQTGIMLGFSSR